MTDDLTECTELFVKRILDFSAGRCASNSEDDYMRNLRGTNRKMVEHMVSDFVETVRDRLLANRDEYPGEQLSRASREKWKCNQQQGKADD